MRRSLSLCRAFQASCHLVHHLTCLQILVVAFCPAVNASAAVPVAAAALLHVAVAEGALLHTSRREGDFQGQLRKHKERPHPWQPRVAAVAAEVVAVGAAGH